MCARVYACRQLNFGRIITTGFEIKAVCYLTQHFKRKPT